MKLRPSITEISLVLALVAPVPAVAAAAKTQTLWNTWYTMTIGGKVRFGYYNDKVERKDGKIAYQNQLWKTEEGFINEERVVSFGKDDDDLTPLLFNFRATYRDTEMTIDGTFSGSELTVKARRGKESLPTIHASVGKGVFLSTLFQAWLGKKIPSLKPGKRKAFSTLFEDALDKHYLPIPGGVTLLPDDAFSKKTGTRKLSVDLDGVNSTWYVLPSGESVRIEKPDQKLVIEKASEAEARRFLVKRTE